RLTAPLEAAIDPAKMVEALGDLAGRNLELARDRHCGRGIQDVVAAGYVQVERAERTRRGVDQKTREAASLLRRQQLHAKIGVGGEAVGEDAPAHARQNGFEERIVDTGRD